MTKYRVTVIESMTREAVYEVEGDDTESALDHFWEAVGLSITPVEVTDWGNTDQEFDTIELAGA